MVPVSEIRNNDYDLTFNKYREIEKIKKIFRPTKEIIADIEKLNNEIIINIDKLKGAIDED